VAQCEPVFNFLFLVTFSLTSTKTVESGAEKETNKPSTRLDFSMDLLYVTKAIEKWLFLFGLT
jgi:hypothetical protein